MIILRNKIYSDSNSDEASPKNILIAGGAATGATSLGTRIIGYKKAKNKIIKQSNNLRDLAYQDAAESINGAKNISNGMMRGYNDVYKHSGILGKRRVLKRAKKLRNERSNFINNSVDEYNKAYNNIGKSEEKALNRINWASKAKAGKLALVGGAVTLGAAGLSKLKKNIDNKNNSVDQTNNLTAPLYNLPDNSTPNNQKTSNNIKSNIIVK